MGALPAIFAIIKSGASIFFEFAKTWVGGFVIAFCIAWVLSGHRAHVACDAREAAAKAQAEAAVREKMIEWKTASENIARDATKRDEKDAVSSKAQGTFIAGLIRKGNGRVPSTKNLSTDFSGSYVFLDPDYVGIVRAFDAAASRNADSASGPGKLRKAGSIAQSDRCAAVKIFALRNRAAASEANRRLVNDADFYRDVRRAFSSP